MILSLRFVENRITIIQEKIRKGSSKWTSLEYIWKRYFV